MQHKALPHDGAGTLHHVVDAAWQATAVPQLCDQLPDPRRELAGLRDNSVASQDRRGTLHRGNQQGEVGGTQQTDDAPWHPIAPRANLLYERGRQHLHTLIEEQIEGPNAGEDFLPTLPEGLACLAAPIGQAPLPRATWSRNRRTAAARSARENRRQARAPTSANSTASETWAWEKLNRPSTSPRSPGFTPLM